MTTILLTVVRHGESTDNVNPIWAGHRDAPLSAHGLKQAERLGKSLAEVPITAIYSSDLSRAHTTAKNIQQHNKSQPPPALIASPLLREQFWGDAEGTPHSEGVYAFSVTNAFTDRAYSNPNGENLEEVALRARVALRAFVLPHLLSQAPKQHIFVVAHGIFLDEFLSALGAAQDKGSASTGFANTGWAQFELTHLADHPGTLADKVPELKPPKGHELASTVEQFPVRGEGAPAYLGEGEPSPAFVTKVLALNQHSHLEGLLKEDDAAKSDVNFLGGGKQA